jgi:hypothetical protein
MILLRLLANGERVSARLRLMDYPVIARSPSLITAAAAMQCGSKPVSGRGLPKTGIFPHVAGDYRRFRFRRGQIRSLETHSQFAKARYWRAFLRLLGVVSPSAGLAG